MAHQIGVLDLSLIAAADYSSNQFYCMTQNTSNGRATLAATRGAKVIGVLNDDPDAAGVACSVRVLGVAKVVAGAAISYDDELTVDASGRAIPATQDSDYVWGRALASASAAGEVIPAFVTIGGIGKGTGVVAADGFIPLPLATARELATNDIPAAAANGGLLASDSTPVLAAINAGTDQQLRATWAAGNTDKLTWQVPLPKDLDDSADMTLHVFGVMGGSTDTPTLTWEAFFGVGDTDAGGATAALSDTRAEVTRTIAAANVEAHPEMLTVTVAPGAHGTDTVAIESAWIEYTRK